MDQIIQAIVDNHQLWLTDPSTGTQADLSCKDLSGLDFSPYDMSRCKLNHANIDGATFSKLTGSNLSLVQGTPILAGCDISNSNFEACRPETLLGLMNSLWRGIQVVYITPWLVSEKPYWCFKTNAFLQVGCGQDTLAATIARGESVEAMQELAPKYPGINVQQIYDWWQVNKDLITNA